MLEDCLSTVPSLRHRSQEIGLSNTVGQHFDGSFQETMYHQANCARISATGGILISTATLSCNSVLRPSNDVFYVFITLLDC
jgi:hypothetical protein